MHRKVSKVHGGGYHSVTDHSTAYLATLWHLKRGGTSKSTGHKTPRTPLPGNRLSESARRRYPSVKKQNVVVW